MRTTWPRVFNLIPSQLCQIVRSQKNPLEALRIFKEAKSKYPNYSHNGPAYATMIGILAKSGRITEMTHVINLMKEDSCECRDSVFTFAMKSYARVGRLDDAVALFRSLPQFNCVDWTGSFTVLLQMLLEESKFEAAISLFLENSHGWEVKSRAHSLHLLIDALCRRNRSDQALQVFLEMNSQCYYPERDTYLVLMRGLCADGKLNEATHLLYSMFWRISQKGCGGDVVIYRTLLNALCENGQGRNAVGLLRKILMKGLKGSKRHLKRFDLKEWSIGEGTQPLKASIGETLISGVIPSMSSYSAMAVDLYSEGCIADANKVIDVMLDKGYTPSSLIFEAKVAALFREGSVSEAIKVIDVEMVKGNCVPNARVYNLVIQGLCDAGKSVKALVYFEKMVRQPGCDPDEETFCLLVDGLCRDKHFIDASRVLERMLAKAFWPRVDTYNTLVRGLCFLGRKYEAVMWLEEMICECKMPDISVWDALVTSVSDVTANTASCDHLIIQVSS